MTTSTIKAKIQEDMKDALRKQQKERLLAIRLILAAVKQREVDERITELSDEQVLVVLDKMQKQRRDSIAQYEAAQRDDLAQKEKEEVRIIQQYLPAPLNEAEIGSLIEAAIQETGALTARDMGKVMGALKPQIQGRADIALVSQQVKERLSA